VQNLTSKSEFHNLEGCNCSGACACVQICLWWPQSGDSMAQSGRTQASLF